MEVLYILVIRSCSTVFIVVFWQRKLPSPGFLVEVVLVDYNGNDTTSTPETVTNKSDERSSTSAAAAPVDVSTTAPDAAKAPENHDKEDDVFSDGEAEDSASSRSRQAKAESEAVSNSTGGSESKNSNQVTSLTQATEKVSLGSTSAVAIDSGNKPKSEDGRTVPNVEAPSSSESEFKAMAADASVFTFGDDEDYESE